MKTYKGMALYGIKVVLFPAPVLTGSSSKGIISAFYSTPKVYVDLQDKRKKRFSKKKIYAVFFKVFFCSQTNNPLIINTLTLVDMYHLEVTPRHVQKLKNG